ncbi:hypothetical protein [Yersinia enterocolitica]|uniref:hypothetical protein n=1 Tax=Yersinia enterocolitica TaxID=630 RepID=UPI00398CE358
MIEYRLKSALERITGLPTFPLLLPNPEREGVTYQRISDPSIDTGLVRTRLVEVRFQVTLYVIDDYDRIIELDSAIWQEWRQVVQGDIEGYPVQYVRRAGIQQDKTLLTNNSIQYRYSRDYIIYFVEADT